MDDALSYWDNYGSTPGASASAMPGANGAGRDPSYNAPTTAETTAQSFDVGSFLGSLANSAATVLTAQNGVRAQQPTGQPATTTNPTVLVAAPGAGAASPTIGGIPTRTIYIVGGSILAALVLFKLVK